MTKRITFLKYGSELRELYYSGLSRQSIAKSLSISRTSVDRLIKEGRFESRQRPNGSASAKWTGYGDISGKYWSSLRCAAKNRDIKFNISIKEAWLLFENQQQQCSLTGVVLTHGSGRTICGKNRILGTASLDRIDSSKGYVKSNIQWIHKDINLMKNHFSQEYFISMCQKITENQLSRG